MANIKKQTHTQEELLTISEVAHILRVDPATVRRWCTTGALKAIRIPSGGLRPGYRIQRKIIEELLDIKKSVTPANLQQQ